MQCDFPKSRAFTDWFPIMSHRAFEER